MEKFNTPVEVEVEVEIDYDSVTPPGFSYESRSSNANIEYQFILELRSWGIKSFSFILPTQEITFDLELIKDTNEDYESFSFKLKIEGDTEIPDNISAGDICPQSIYLEITELRQIDEHSFEGIAKAVLSFESV